MSQFTCPQCGAPLEPGVAECKFCGEKFAQQQMNGYQQAPQQQMGGYQQAPQPTVIIQQGYGPQGYGQQGYYGSAINPAWPIKNKIVAGILAILLGGIGVHKFYLGQIGMGILYVCFCWSGIPAIIGLVEGIIYLTQNDENFMLKNHCRIG